MQTILGAPLREGLMLIHNTLVDLSLRDKLKIIASGKLVSAFGISRVLALGADACNMARGFMFALGCIQAQACHTGKCPTGVTSQDPSRYRALDVNKKYIRVMQFHHNALEALKKSIEACGLKSPQEFTAHHLMIRINNREVRSTASQYDWLQNNELLGDVISHPAFNKFWGRAQTTSLSNAA